MLKKCELFVFVFVVCTFALVENRSYNNGLIFYNLRTSVSYLPPTVSVSRGRSLANFKFSEKGSIWSTFGQPCECGGVKCGCCAGLRVKQYKFDQKLCANITFIPRKEEALLEVFLNENPSARYGVSARNPSPFCIPVMMGVPMAMCVQMSNIGIQGNNLNMCMDFIVQLATTDMFEMHFQCMKMGLDGVQYVDKNGNPVIPPGSKAASTEPTNDEYYDETPDSENEIDGTADDNVSGIDEEYQRNEEDNVKQNEQDLEEENETAAEEDELEEEAVEELDEESSVHENSIEQQELVPETIQEKYQETQAADQVKTESVEEQSLKDEATEAVPLKSEEESTEPAQMILEHELLEQIENEVSTTILMDTDNMETAPPINESENEIIEVATTKSNSTTTAEMTAIKPANTETETEAELLTTIVAHNFDEPDDASTDIVPSLATQTILTTTTTTAAPTTTETVNNSTKVATDNNDDDDDDDDASSATVTNNESDNETEATTGGYATVETAPLKNVANVASTTTERFDAMPAITENASDDITSDTLPAIPGSLVGTEPATAAASMAEQTPVIMSTSPVAPRADDILTLLRRSFG